MRFHFAVFVTLLCALSMAWPASAKTRHWQEDGIFGQSEETRMPAGKSFDAMVSDYFARMSRRCDGDFANALGDVRSAGGVTLQPAEMACVDDKDNAAAALLFVGKGRTFIAITQEGTQEQMETALAKRDALMADFASGK
jgi:hypothetical protein